MRARAHEDIMLPRPHSFLDFDQESPSFANSCSVADSAIKELPGISNFSIIRVGLALLFWRKRKHLLRLRVF